MRKRFGCKRRRGLPRTLAGCLTAALIVLLVPASRADGVTKPAPGAPDFLTVSIFSGAELALALLNESVTEAVLAVPYVDFSETAWADARVVATGTVYPFPLRRNFSIRGSPELPEWPLIDLAASKKMMLMDDVALMLEHVVLYQTCWLLARPEPVSHTSSLETALRFRKWATNISQEGCIMGSSSLAKRCWPRKDLEEDMALAGADTDQTGKPQPTNYRGYLQDVITYCRSLVSLECLLTQSSPIGCMLLALHKATMPPLIASPALAPPPGTTGSQATAASDGGSQPLTAGGSAGASAGGTGAGTAGASTTPIIVGCVVGGSCVIAGPLAFPSAVRVHGHAAPYSPDLKAEEQGVLVCEDGAGGHGPRHSRVSFAPSLLSDASSAAPEIVTLLPTVLGKGSFGRVQEGQYRGRKVAVKLMLGGPLTNAASSSTMHRLSILVQELETLSRCEHPNVVKLLAASLEPPRPFVVLEHMETSLDKLLYGRDQPAAILPMYLVLHIAKEVAQGLDYLDFGLARVRETMLVTQDPECFDVQCHGITHKMDIYSFGVVFWEMLAGARPWSNLGPLPIAVQASTMHRRGGGRGHYWAFADLGHGARGLGHSCFERDPLRRPAAAEVVKRVALIKEGLQAAGALPADP
ncbi:hypothetical protein HYH03_011752 [Edaphochlamys debaryana]|uniref:Protein kinase domain-containing protein n=1 Tax=Edaphochlamys debaryana TaxID=47281 RepID=A0A835XVG7_9CHLO|nr:hypothetical protein HYH03_011752 [Edaphochlamys debaryana]|eukprot:KAG2489803.1 hypothetical protein HYH03_011752 [Edaphochlamys debaryana]